MIKQVTTYKSNAERDIY